MNEPQQSQQYTPEELGLIAAQTQAQQTAAQQDTGLFGAQEADMESSRQFYLGYEDELDQLIHMWRGDKKNDKDRWVRDRSARPMMDDAAIGIVKTMLNNFLIRAVRLGNYEPKMVNTYAYQARKHISKWLHTSGWQKYKIELEYLNVISFQCGQIAHAALTWAQNAGGRHFMTTTNRTIENVSYVNPGGQGQGGRGGQGDGGSRRFLKLPKIPKPW